LEWRAINIAIHDFFDTCAGGSYFESIIQASGSIQVYKDDTALNIERRGTMTLPLGAGDKSPDFTLNNKDSRATTLNEFAGKWVILFFYPKDNTSG
jgi:hypothetical protein